MTPGLFIKCWIVASRCCGVMPPSSRQIWVVSGYPSGMANVAMTHIETSSLETESDQIKERDELRAGMISSDDSLEQE